MAAISTSGDNQKDPLFLINLGRKAYIYHPGIKTKTVVLFQMVNIRRLVITESMFSI